MMSAMPSTRPSVRHEFAGVVDRRGPETQSARIDRPDLQAREVGGGVGSLLGAPAFWLLGNLINRREGVFPETRAQARAGAESDPGPCLLVINR